MKSRFILLGSVACVTAAALLVPAAGFGASGSQSSGWPRVFGLESASAGKDGKAEFDDRRALEAMAPAASHLVQIDLSVARTVSGGRLGPETIDGRQVTVLSDLKLETLRFEPKATVVHTSGTTETRLSSPSDVWFGVWSGDGGSKVIVVVEDGSGKLLSSRTLRAVTPNVGVATGASAQGCVEAEPTSEWSGSRVCVK